MPEYRARTIGDDGSLIGYEEMVCADDGEAIGRASRRSKRYTVELWSGGRLVNRQNASSTAVVNKNLKAAVTHEVEAGRLVPKTAV